MNIFILLSVITTINLSFSPFDVEIKRGGHPYIEDGVIGFDIGKPSIPGCIVYIVSFGDEDIEINYKNPVVLGKYDVPPLQRPRILSVSDVSIISPDAEIYTSNKEYPGKKFERLRTRHIAGKTIEAILVYPLQYRPLNKELILYQDVEIEGDFCLYDHLSEWSKTDSSGYEYLIITNNYYTPYFEPLAEWKTKKGIKTRIVTTNYIYSNFDGRDNQEKIREFIKTQYQDSGVVWVLLGGDVNIVPARTAFAMTCGAGSPDEDSLQCDLYYSDLDGTWDLDGDGIFGEVEDSVDMMPDVFVGRAPVNSIPEFQNFVNKVLTYEKSPPCDYITDALFFAMVLWGAPGDPDYTDGGVHKDMIEELFIPPQFNITKLYERDGNGSAGGVIDTINEGRHIMNHDGHGWINVIGMDPGSIYNWDMDNLTNGDKLGILLSIGCWTAAFDYDCIAEHFINSTTGGGVAYIGNSRYGWGSPGNPGYGYSDIFDNKFFEAVFVDSVVNIGKALGYAKAYYVPLADCENVYRWCEYELNLLGDPEMPIWTDTPKPVTVLFPDSIHIGEFTLYIQVFLSDGSPVEGARVVISGKDYKIKTTEPSGEAVLSLSTDSPGWTYITVTGTNILPYEDSIYVYCNGAHLSLYEHHTEKELHPNDTSSLYCIIKNYGDITSGIKEVTITSDDTLTTITSNVDTLTSIPPGGQDTLDFEIVISDEATNGHTMRFSLSDIGEFTEMVKTPILSISGIYKDGPLTPGDSGTLFLELKNTGYGKAEDVTLMVQSTDTLLQFIDTLIEIECLFPDSSVTSYFDLFVLPECPFHYVVNCIADFASIDTFPISIGNYGISEDFEGDNAWYYTGEWHLDTHRSYSASHSFYCGDSLTREYGVNVCDTLVSPPFYIDESSTLTFWHWFDMAGLEDLGEPGCDGLYIGVIDSSEFHLLDFIGSGGALDSMYNSCPYWQESEYDLSFISPGREVRILFKFISNGSRCGEGWYIDDVSVQPTYLGVEEDKPRFVLFQNYPNPFRGETVIKLASGTGHSASGKPTTNDQCPMTISIYDLSGRLVRTLPITDYQLPITKVVWDGSDDNGKPLPAGIYFYRLQAGELIATKKLTLLR